MFYCSHITNLKSIEFGDHQIRYIGGMDALLKLKQDSFLETSKQKKK